MRMNTEGLKLPFVDVLSSGDGDNGDDDVRSVVCSGCGAPAVALRSPGSVLPSPLPSAPLPFPRLPPSGLSARH